MNEAPDRGPPATEKISWLDPVQSTITHAGFTAHLLNDTLKIFNEGRGMEHCLYRSYMSKITSGHYVAFHIDAPHLNEFGFTCGIRFQEQTDSINGRPVWEAVVPTLSWFDFSADTPANPPSITKRLRGNWAVDQVRGKRNSIPEDPQLLGFAEDLATMLNETIQGHQPSTWKRVDRARPVQEFWRTITAEGLHDRHT
jgi:hypothetical protein